MMRRVAAGLALAFAPAPWAALEAAPADGDLVRHVSFLASERLEGRLTGTPAERKAARYIADELERLGARPLAGLDGFLLPFEFTAGTSDAGSSLVLTAPEGGRSRSFKGTRQVRALSFSEAGRASGPVLFAGYGLTVPEGQDVVYDSYAGLDVKDKIVLVLRYGPEDAGDELRPKLMRYSGLRFKALRARELGAAALLVVSGPRSPNAGETVPESFDSALSGSGIVAASIGGELASTLFAGQPRTLEEAQRALDGGNPHVAGFDLTGVAVALDVKIRRERRTGHDVLARLPAPAGATEGCIVLGAHYDHLGHGSQGNSLAKKGEAGKVHPGADDNASGVAAVLAAARELAAAPRRSEIVLAFWSGEELGLLGSSAFLQRGIVPRERIRAYVNFDMVGRMRDNRLDVQGAGSSSGWPRLVEQANVPVGFDLRLHDDPFLPTDSAAFYQAGVPSLSLFTGSHEDYHRPTDVAERVNYEDLARVGAFATVLARKLDGLDAPLDYVKVERPSSSGSGGDRDTVRAFTGTIPDYTAEVQGLRLSGVVGGGPADKAGLREGDVIVEFAGRTITNIYDYTYALDAVRVGQPVRVVVLRDGARQEITITPTTRP